MNNTDKHDNNNRHSTTNELTESQKRIEHTTNVIINATPPYTDSASSFSAKLAQRSLELIDIFVHSILQESNREKCIDHLHEFVTEFGQNPGLIDYCLPHRFINPFREYLLNHMYRASYYGDIDDCLFFKYIYFLGYVNTIDASKRRLYFTSYGNIESAADFDRDPPSPICDPYMFKSLLGDAGNGAFTITFSRSEEELRKGITMLRFTDRKKAKQIRSLLYQEMTNSVLFEFYCFSFSGGEIPSWLEKKRYLLIWLQEGVMPDELINLLSFGELMECKSVLDPLFTTHISC